MVCKVGFIFHVKTLHFCSQKKPDTMPRSVRFILVKLTNVTVSGILTLFWQFANRLCYFNVPAFQVVSKENLTSLSNVTVPDVPYL